METNSTPLTSKVMQVAPTYKSIKRRSFLSFDKQIFILIIAGIFFIAGFSFWIYVNYFLK